MSIFGVVLLLIAYSFGLVTLCVQIICYLKKMENLVTILFSAAFLLLIISLTLTELDLLINESINFWLGELVTFSMILMAISTPVNIHTERKISFTSTANKLVYGLGFMLFVVWVIGYVTDQIASAEYVIMTGMIISIAYAMVLILITKPSLLIKHREKLERRNSIIFLAIFPFFLVIQMFYDQLTFLHSWLTDGPYILPVFFIFLTSNKLLDDLQRLTLFSPNNKLNPHVYSKFEITKREQEVMDLIIKGLSYNQIGDRLHISLPTVKTHVTNIYQKMKVGNKVELINLANSLK
ncbi:MAG: helix-turn-helix transcriptional regulator [Cyclobacteriaceae bacterium]